MKDYARKSHRKTQKTKPKSRKRLTLSVIALAIVVPLAMFFVRVINNTHTAEIEQPKVVSVPEPKLTDTAQQQETEFDFYTLLPNMKVDGNENNPNNKQQQATYVLEVASFLQRSDAEHLKTQLSLMGFGAFIQDYNRGQSVRYRVLVGPYNQFKSARNDQIKLRQQHLSSSLRRLKTHS